MTAIREPHPTQFNYQYPPQQYPGQFYPAHPNQPSADPNRQPNKRGKKGLAIVGAAAIGAGVVGGGLYVMNKLGMGEVKAPASSETEQVIETPTLTAEAVDAQVRFDAQRSESDESIRQGLTDLGWGYANYFKDDSVAASKDMTPAEILTRNTSETQWLLENDDEEQALRDVDLVAMPGTEPHRGAERMIRDTTPESNKSVEPIMPIGTPYHFSEGIHDGISADGVDTWIIPNTSLTDSSRGVAVYQWAEKPDGTGGEWILVANDSPETNPNFNTTYADLLKKPS